MTLSAKALYLALSRLLRVLLMLFALLYIPNMLAFGVVGGLNTALLIFIFLGCATLVAWVILEILMPKLSSTTFYYCAAAIGAIVMLAYWLLEVRDQADLFFLPLFMIVSAAFGALLATYLRAHQQKHASRLIHPPHTKCKLLFAAATLCVMFITVSGYLVSDYSNTAIILVQKGETAQLRYFRPNSHPPPNLLIHWDTFASENSDWDVFEKHPVILRSRSDSGCEQMLRSEAQSFEKLTSATDCEIAAGFHTLDIEIIEADPASLGKILHIRPSTATHFKSLSHQPYYLFAQLYFGAAALWLWLALWGIQLAAQSRATRSFPTPSATV